MHVRRCFVWLSVILAACSANRAAWAADAPDLLTARKAFVTKLDPAPASQPAEDTRADAPPPNLYSLVHYRSPAGELAAYLSAAPHDAKLRPAIIWAHGGFGGIGDYYYQMQSANNDQTPAAFREAGMVVMIPSWRGENDNPGRFEEFYGEVDDALAAIAYVSKLPYVDPKRIYFAGHSTGGTLTLLAAEASTTLRAAFSIGGAPDLVHTITNRDSYGECPYDPSNSAESAIRSANRFVSSLKTPTWYFEGEASRRYLADARAMEQEAVKSQAPFHVAMLRGSNHFNHLRSLTHLLAAKIAGDDGPTCKIQITEDEANAAFQAELLERHKMVEAVDKLFNLSATTSALDALHQAASREAKDTFLRIMMDQAGTAHLRFDSRREPGDLTGTLGDLPFATDVEIATRLGTCTIKYLPREHRFQFITQPATQPAGEP